MQQETLENQGKDLAHNWVSTSRFIWFCQVFMMVAFLLGGCYALYGHSWKGKPEVSAPENTQYNPKYK